MTPKDDNMAPKDEVKQRLAALNSFKDWSNYLLVTTVAALGWVVKYPTEFGRAWIIGFLGSSIVFGIFTLALIPLVAEGVTAGKSFYDVKGKFKLLFLWGPERTVRLKAVCWPQHVLFLAGIIMYTIAGICAPNPTSH